eukprot:350242-Chlamydomonas_euryale.AAC.3
MHDLQLMQYTDACMGGVRVHQPLQARLQGTLARAHMHASLKDEIARGHTHARRQGTLSPIKKML